MSEWTTFMHSKERLQFLSSKISSVQLRPTVESLSKLALEVVLSRNSAREVIQGDYSKEEKKVAKDALKELEKFEKRIAYLYSVGRIYGAKWTAHPELRKAVRKVMARPEEW